MKKINTKRKKGGGGINWGNGLDYLLKDYWGDLDKLIEDNYHNQHNKKLIDFLFSKIPTVLESGILEMKKNCNKKSDRKGVEDWISKVKSIQSFGKSAKRLNEKVIFIDNATQFLRETSLGKRKKIYKPKKIKPIKNFNGEIKGIIGYAGLKIKGVVKIIFDEKDFSKLKKGDVLVTKETNASFLPMMKKASAFVTDFGGVLSHAAIVARELKKPCILGTKIATQVLKDGDLVEVDAKNGFVNIVKKG